MNTLFAVPESFRTAGLPDNMTTVINLNILNLFGNIFGPKPNPFSTDDTDVDASTYGRRHDDRPQEGKVIAIGTGKLDDDGKPIPFNVKKGDKVLMPKYGGTEVKIDDKEYQIVREDDILAVID